MSDTLVVTGVSPSDVIFENQCGTWNVSKIERDALAGKFGKVGVVEVAPCIAATKQTERDPDKVALFMRRADILKKPLLIAMENGQGWLVDGNHRVAALARLGSPVAPAYIVPEELEPHYRVLFNGHRTIEQASEADA